MRVRLIFLVLSVILLTENATSSDIDFAGILQLGIRFILINLKRIGAITLTNDTTITIPDNLEQFSIGSVNLKNAQIYGFDTIDIININASNNELDVENSTRINVCLNISIDQLGISTKYNADIGIINEIPIYGDGELNLAVQITKFDLCMNINIEQNFSQLYVDELELKLSLHDSPSYITRFWKSDSASEIVTAIMNIIEDYACMWLSYEKQCISCVISPVIQYVINKILPNDFDDDLEINCSCLNQNFGNYNVEEIVTELLKAYNEDKLENLFKNENLSRLQGLFRTITENIETILKEEGFSIEM